MATNDFRMPFPGNTTNRHERRANAKWGLKQVKRLREGLRLMRANPNAPHCVQDPGTGETIDVLDGETDKLLNQMEAFALFDLGFRPSGRG